MGDEIAIQAFAAQCVCGRRLALDPTQIGRHVVCPACSRVIIPVLAEATSIPARSLGDRGTFAEQAPATSSHESPPPTATAVDDSAPIIVLHLSQWDNFWKYLTCLMVEVLAGGLFLIPSLRPWAAMIVAAVSGVVVITAFFVFLHARMTRCIISENRIETQKGIFTRQIDWVSLNCVLDIQLHQGFVQRILGVGTICVRSTDKITPLLEVPHVPRAKMAFNFLQEQLNRRSKLLSLVR